MGQDKIVMVNAPVHAIPPVKGAAVEWWITQVSRRLQGVEPHVISITAEGLAREERRDGVCFHRIHLGALYRRLFQKITRLDPWSYAHRVAHRIARLKPAIVHVHNAPALLRRLRALCPWPSARYVLHMHNAVALGAEDPAVPLYVNSRYLQRWYAGRHPGAAIEIVTNGVDLEAFQPRWQDAAQDGERRRRLGLPADSKIVLFVGRISPEKGALDLVRAFAQLARTRGDVFLLLVGELRTQGAAGDARAEYGRAVSRACEGLNGRCRLTGVVAPGSVQDYYRLGDLLVIPSEFEEPFGMVAIEGMACGIPVLAARKGGLPEFITSDATGYLIEDAKDSKGFAAQIDALLNRSQDLDRVRRAARAYVEQHHGWDTVTRALEARYAELLGRP